MIERRPGGSLGEFENLVRDALLHMYDATHLQTHPLAQLVKGSPGNNAVLRGKLLFQELLATIRLMRPVAGTPTDSRAWRTYRLLELRYVEGLSAADAIDQLALGKTQYHRDHTRALETVASILRERWGVEHFQALHPAGSESLESLALAETEQMTTHMTISSIDLVDMVTGLLGLLCPVIEENRLKVILQPQPGLPPVYGDRVVLRQIFLGLLNTAIQQAAGGTLIVSIALAREDIEVEIAGPPIVADTEPIELPDRSSLELDVVHRLVNSLGGRLEVKLPPGARIWRMTMALPIAHRPLVLVVDNHPGFIGLVARYLAEHGWQVVGAQDVQQAKLLVQELQPRVILLDIMMPGEDGWDLLLTLKSRPETRQIAVIVCSILYEPQIAGGLGADGYLAKPITQITLLEALEPWRPGGPGLVSSR